MIITNKIKCNKCGDIITSYNVHDFKECSCRSVAVDGGHLYLRRCGDDWTELSIVENLPWETTMHNVSMALDIDEVNLSKLKKLVLALKQYVAAYCERRGLKDTKFNSFYTLIESTKDINELDLRHLQRTLYELERYAYQYYMDLEQQNGNHSIR